jgi:hypothetical protein
MPKPDLLAQAEDDMRLFLGALLGELKRFRARRSRSYLSDNHGQADHD